jgi:uncharacterized protein involved in type VI secretion and phage assembly
MEDQMSKAEEETRWYGVYSALVTDIRDPDGQGRVKVRLPAMSESFEVWARLATLMAGRKSGSWFVPDTDSEVLVAFEAGDLRRPFVIGALWNGVDTVPERMDSAGRTFRKLLRSRNGIQVVLDDQDGKEMLALETPGGQRVTLEDGSGSIEIVDRNGNSIRLETGGVTVTAAARVTISASAVDVSAGVLTVNAGMSRFSGVVQADTVVANSVISASYSPGAGNLV